MLWALSTFVICRIQVVYVCVCVRGVRVGGGEKYVHFSKEHVFATVFHSVIHGEKSIISFVKNAPYQSVWNIIVKTF